MGALTIDPENPPIAMPVREEDMVEQLDNSKNHERKELMPVSEGHLKKKKLGRKLKA